MQPTPQARREGSRPDRGDGGMTPKASCRETFHRLRVKPVDVGIASIVDDGTLLEWIDKAAYATLCTGVPATVLPRPSTTFTSTGPSVSVNSSNCAPPVPPAVPDERG